MKMYVALGVPTLTLCIVRMILAQGTFAVELFLLVAWCVWAIVIYRREVRE